MRRLLGLVVIACSSVAAAQPESEATTTAEPPQSPGRKLSPRTDIVMASYSASHNGQLDVRDLRLKAAAPVVVGDGYGVALLMGYDSTHLDSAMSTNDHLALHCFEAMLGGGMGLAPGWSLRGSVGMSYSSDLQERTWSAVQNTTSAMIHHVIGPSDAIVGGLVYTSTADLFPVLPLLGYVHQRDGSPFRFDVFLPHHVRAEYEFRPRLRGAIGAEASGNNWVLQRGPSEVRARREGGAAFGEFQVGITAMLHVEARAGMSVDRYTMPMQPDGASIQQPLRASAFAQLSVVVAP
jgi:hypothetical protein